MKQLIPLMLLFFLILNPVMLSAESNGGSVTDFYNQNQNESNEEERSEQSTEDESVTDQPANNDDDSINIIGLSLQIIAVLALIIGLLYGLLKFFNRSNYFNKQGDVLVNLGGVSLGTNKSVQMLKVGEQVFLVGVGDDINVLTEITDESIKQELFNRQKSPGPTAQSILEQLNFKRKGQKTESDDFRENEDYKKRNFAALFKGELDTMKEKRAKIRANRKEED